MTPISYLNRAKIILLIEMDVSEARVATQFGLPKSSVNFIVRRWRERVDYLKGKRVQGIHEHRQKKKIKH
jgi:hypothetical protein